MSKNILSLRLKPEIKTGIFVINFWEIKNEIDKTKETYLQNLAVIFFSNYVTNYLLYFLGHQKIFFVFSFYNYFMVSVLFGHFLFELLGWSVWEQQFCAIFTLSISTRKK
mgnify:CR=1 FL=1